MFAYGSVPKDHIPTDYGVRLQFHIIVPLNEINLSRIAEPKIAKKRLLKPQNSNSKVKQAPMTTIFVLEELLELI